MIVLSVLLAACEGEQTALPTITSEPLDYIELPLGPDEIIHIAGEVSLVSKPFALEGPGGLKVYWKQDCEEFILSMVNTNEALAEAKTILKWLMVQAILEQATGTSPLAEAVPAKASRSGSGVDTPVLGEAEGAGSRRPLRAT